MNNNPYYTKPQKRAAIEDASAVATGAISGAQSGGAVGAAVGGVLGMYGSTVGRIGSANKLADTDFSISTNYDSTTDPTYQGEDFIQSQGLMQELSDKESSLEGTGLKMAAIGGPLAGVIAGNFSKRARQKLQEKRNEVSNKIRSSQEDFNQASEGFEQREVAQEQYRRNRNRTNRLYNLYNATGQQLY